MSISTPVLRNNPVIIPSDRSKQPASTPSLLKNTPAAASKKPAPAKKTMPSYYNNIFQFSGKYAGSIGPGVQVVEVRWQQAPFKKGVKYPPGSKAVIVRIFKNGVELKGARTSYIDKNGMVHAHFMTSEGKVEKLLSRSQVWSPKMKALVAAMRQIQLEDGYVRQNSLRKLPYSIKDEHGNVIATKGALMLAALIKSMGVRNVAYKTSALAAKIYDNAQRLMNLKGMGKVVHHVVDHTGLRITKHPTRGRMLQPGQAQAGPSVIQRASIVDLLQNMPAPPWQQTIRDIVGRAPVERRQPTAGEVQTLLTAIRDAVEGTGPVPYREELTDYLTRQHFLFPNGVTGTDREVIRLRIEMLLTGALMRRDGAITSAIFQDTIANAVRSLDRLHSRGVLAVTGREFVDMLLALPGFETNANVMRNGARRTLQEALTLRNQVHRDFYNERNLPAEIIALILGLALILTRIP